MRPLSILLNPLTLFLLQLSVSSWFLFDFFIARDSFSARALWKQKQTKNEQLDQIESLSDSVQTRYCQEVRAKQKTFDKIVLVVIDALGSEFIPSINIQNDQKTHKHYEDSMPYVQSSLSNRRAMGLTAKAATPTVTMPRIKALLSGTIPSFVDVLYNLARDVSKFEDDNILSIARSRNKSLVFYGDDTWLSLFDRSMFKRVEETFSFFASDYTSVDTNVTSKALPETQRENIDWDFLILHYLGLDHIGHVFGSNEAPLIRTKLLEMDSVIEKVTKNMARKEHKTLIIVCGDHGMSQEGNHGGDTELESNTAILFFPVNQNLTSTGSELKPRLLQQIDLSVTLSFLTGLPIPQMSKGVLIEPLLRSLWSFDKKLLPCALVENSIQLAMLTDYQPPELLELASLLKKQHDSDDSFINSADQYLDLTRRIQRRLLEEIASRSSPVLVTIAVTISSGLLLLGIRRIALKLLFRLEKQVQILVMTITFMLPIFLVGSTDFIENEHIFWPTYSLVTMVAFVLTGLREHPNAIQKFDWLKVSLFLITFILTALWNSQKLCRDQSTFSSSILPFFSLTILCNSTRLKSDIKRFNSLITILVCIVTIMFTKSLEESPGLNDTENVIYRATVQKVAALIIIGFTVINIFSSSRDPRQGTTSTLCKVASGWMCLTFLISRKRMFVFLISNVIMEASVNSIANSLNMSLLTRAIIYITFAQGAFYNQGNSNLFTTIDVKPAFFGQTEYNLYISVPLVALSTFSTQIYWYIKMLQKIEEVKSNQEDEISGYRISSWTAVSAVRNFVMARNFLSLNYYFYVCIVLRNHIFLWSVISPKLVYHFTSNLVLSVALILTTNLSLLRQRRCLDSMTELKTNQN